MVLLKSNINQLNYTKMKIIEEKQNVEKVIKKTCHKCKSKLAYLPSDVKTDRDGKYIECPCCLAYIGVS